MDLPSFLWLWRIAAWSMGLSLTTYGILAIAGLRIRHLRLRGEYCPPWLRWLHLVMGGILVGLVLLLLGIGIVGTLGRYGSLGHSIHLIAGLVVVGLVLISAFSALQIGFQRHWARSLHLWTNLVLLVGFIGVTVTGWSVVQKYLP